MYDKAPYPLEAEVPKQQSHQSRLLSAASAVRRSTQMARDILNALQGAPHPISGNDKQAETAGQPALATVLENVPNDIQDACEKLNGILNELRATLRI